MAFLANEKLASNAPTVGFSCANAMVRLFITLFAQINWHSLIASLQNGQDIYKSVG